MDETAPETAAGNAGIGDVGATPRYAVVPRENPPDGWHGVHDTKEAAEKAAGEAPWKCYVQQVWTADEDQATSLVEKLTQEVPRDVELSTGHRHWDWIPKWQDESPLVTTIRVRVGPTTGVAEPTEDAVRREIARQRESHQGLLPDTVEPWYLTRDER